MTAADQIAGVAKADITPDYAVRLSGYGSRLDEHEGVEQHIFAKALAIGSDAEDPAVLLAVDNCGVPAWMRDELIKRLAARTKVTGPRVAICSTHTHSAPMLTGILPNLFSKDIPPEHRANVERYTRDLMNKLEQVALAALADRRPAQLALGFGHVSFAHNRRGYAFRPEDHSLPVLRVVGADGKVRAMLASYACHATTLSFNKIHGDWPGCAQEFLEKEFPGAIALVAVGCGADQNPNPRRTYEYARDYGNALGEEVQRIVKSGMKPVTGRLECRAKQIELPFDKLPTCAELEKRSKDKNAPTAYHAKVQIAKLDRGEKLPTKLPYLVQVWNFGRDLAMVFLPGEVVVDYSLRLKHEFDSERLWVNGYSNDVPCYIPSERIWAEGGYEGAMAMLYYDRPTRFARGVEQRIIGTVHQLMPRGFRR
ncbi:MAG: neutral/alkaline non-lysosomal ceramidase N-terminal domain-containing protein [Verrucomicrobiia bacterium]